MTPLPSNHPLRQAEWIWPEAYLYLSNHFAQFRWDIELVQVAGAVPFFITADKSYRLFVNGVHVCRGPARGYQSHWPYDEVDLAFYLRPGHNWISVEAYQPGCSTFSYIHENYAGLLTATSDPALRLALTAAKPIMRRSPGHRLHTDRYSLQIDFQEHLDLRHDDRRWITGAEPPVGWDTFLLPPSSYACLSLPFGRPPYDTVEPRQIPLLREELLVPQLPVRQAEGASSDGYLETQNVSWHWIREAQAIDRWQDAAVLSARRTDEELTVTIPPTGTGRFLAVVIPPGEYVLGTVEVSVEGAAGGEILDFHHDQFYRQSTPRFMPIGDGNGAAMGNRLILRGGDNAHSFYHPLGFGAMTLIARDLTQPLTVTLRIRKVGYPFTFRGRFDTSDTILNEIHAACRRTQQLCAMDAYMDTPWREQAQWWGDARVQARNTFYLDGDARLLARGIRCLAGQSVLGLTPGMAPTSAYWCVLPDFALTWILTLWDFYWQTGDLSLVREQRDRIWEVLAYFDTPEARDGSGLLRNDHRFWLFEDWSPLPKDTVPAFLNLWYLLTLRQLATLSALAGSQEDAAKLTQAAAEQTELIERHFLNPETGLLWPALDEAGKPYGEPSVHDQTLAIMLGLSPSAHERMMADVLRPYLRGETIAGAAPSAFWATYVLELAIERGEVDLAVQFIKERWTPMLPTGTTWENFTWEEESGSSCCHAWTSHPSFHLVNALAGVFQMAAAWTDVVIRPTFSPGIDHVSALVPSPQGDIVSEWQRENGEISGRVVLPPGVTGRLHLPGREVQPLSGESVYRLRGSQNKE